VPNCRHRVDVMKLRQTIARVVTRVCPAWLSAQRDDVVQAATLRVIQLIDRLSISGEERIAFASSYLHKVAHSALVDEIRRARRRREVGIEDAEPTAEDVPRADPERRTVAREVGHGIQDCLRRLTRDRRLAVTLHLQGHSVKEAATILDWPEKRTENLVYRGLADLRACLKAKGLAP
jgi:RNA polymerase sigma-70 factor, ECF subfamily